MEDISAVCLPAHSMFVRKQVGVGVPVCRHSREQLTSLPDSISTKCPGHKPGLSHVGHVGCKWALVSSL